VDDDPDAVLSLARLFACYDYGTAIASDADMAVTMASTFGPDVVIVDYRLGDTDGIACLQRLRALPSLNAAVLVLFTGDCEVRVRLRELRSLAAVLVEKPVDGVELVELVSTLVTPTQGPVDRYERLRDSRDRPSN
jgi:DNA-binding response OmpR family regulator